MLHGHQQASWVQDGVMVRPLQSLQPGVASIIRHIHIRSHQWDCVTYTAWKRKVIVFAILWQFYFVQCKLLLLPIKLKHYNISIGHRTELDFRLFLISVRALPWANISPTALGSLRGSMGTFSFMEVLYEAWICRLHCTGGRQHKVSTKI